jgi:hypothetical protein
MANALSNVDRISLTVFRRSALLSVGSLAVGVPRRVDADDRFSCKHVEHIGAVDHHQLGGGLGFLFSGPSLDGLTNLPAEI